MKTKTKKINFKKVTASVLTAAVLLGGGSMAASAVTVSAGGGTFSYGENTIAYLLFQQYANYTHSGWHHATAMMDGHYFSNKTCNGTASVSTPWYNYDSSHNSYWGLD